MEGATTATMAGSPEDPTQGSLLLSVPRAARRLGVHHTSLKRAIRAGRVPAVRIGAREYVPPPALRALAALPAPLARHGDAGGADTAGGASHGAEPHATYVRSNPP